MWKLDETLLNLEHSQHSWEKESFIELLGLQLDTEEGGLCMKVIDAPSSLFSIQDIQEAPIMGLFRAALTGLGSNQNIVGQDIS